MEDKNNYSDLIISTTTNNMFFYYSEYKIPSSPYDYFNAIRLSIFLITAVCVGLPCQIWAFYFVHHHRKTRTRISAFIILLLLNDLFQLLPYPYIVSKLLFSRFLRDLDTDIIVIVSFYLKICSLHLQQLVALERVLTLKCPQISAQIFLSLRCNIVFIIILFFPLMCIWLLLFVFRYRDAGPYVAYLSFGSILSPVCLLVVTGIITYKAPPTPASTPATDNRPGASLFFASMVTLVVLYLPCVLVHCVQYILFRISLSWYIMSYCLLSLTVISEPLLCVLVCRENLSTQTKQTHVELNSEQTVV